MMRVAQVSRPLRAAAQRPASWHAVQMLDMRFQRRAALRTLVRELPTALRSARSVAVVVCNDWGFCGIPELCYHACAHVRVDDLPLGTLAVCPVRPGPHRLRLLRLGAAQLWTFAGGRDDPEWRLDAESGDWKSTSDDAARLPDDTPIHIYLPSHVRNAALGRHGDLPVHVRPNATTRRLQLSTSDQLAGLNARLLARAFPRLTELTIRNDLMIDATQVPQFLRLVFDGLRELRRLELATNVNTYAAAFDPRTMTADDARVERRRRTVVVPRRMQRLVLESYRTRQRLNTDYERSGRAAGTFLVLPRGADVALERLHLDAALAALMPLAEGGDDDADGHSSSSSSSISLSTSTTDFLPNLTSLTLASGCLRARSDLGRMLRLPTLRTVRLSAMGLVTHGDWQSGGGGGSGDSKILCPAVAELALADCEVSLDFLRDVAALYTGLQTFRVSDPWLDSHDTVDVNGAMWILSESIAFRTGALRRVHFPHAASVRFASPAPMPRTGVSCKCLSGACIDCMCFAAGVKCGRACHVPENAREYEPLRGLMRKAVDRSRGVTCCTNADWPAGETSSDVQRSGVPTHSVWLSLASSVDRRWTADILPPATVAADDGDTKAQHELDDSSCLATRQRHLAFVENARTSESAVESWRIDALVYSESLAALVGPGSRCVVGFGVYREIIAGNVTGGGADGVEVADTESDRKRDCAYPCCFCRSPERAWKTSLGAVSAGSFSPSSSRSPTPPSDTATTKASVRTKRGGGKRPAWVHTVTAAGLFEATLAPTSSVA